MANEATKAQLKRFFQNAVNRAQNPDPREKMKRKRNIKKEKIAKKYGF